MFSGFFKDEISPRGVFLLTRAKRSYFSQSRTLVLACRRLPEPPTNQIEAWQELLKEVEHALYLGTIASRDDQDDKTNKSFEMADKLLRDYIQQYGVTLKPGPDTEEVKGQQIQPWNKALEKDRAAGSSMPKKIKFHVSAKLKSLDRTELELKIILWPEITRIRTSDGQWRNASSELPVRVEKDTILYTLLSRLATFDWGKVDLPRVSFKQNPLFYSKFPLESGQFQSSSRLHYIPPLEAWAPLESHKGELHLIVDRDTSKSEGREVALNNSTFSLPDSDIYSNGWHLDDSNSIAVREKGGLHWLLLWNMKEPFVTSEHTSFEDDASTVTLLVSSRDMTPVFKVPGQIPSLTAGELDQNSESIAASTQLPGRVIANSTISTLNETASVHSDPSIVYANSQPQPIQGSIAGFGNDSCTTTSISPDISKEPSLSDLSTSLALSRSGLPSTQESSSQNPVDGATSSAQNAPVYSVVAKPTTAHSSSTNMGTDQRQVRGRPSLSKSNTQPSSSSQIWPASPVSTPASNKIGAKAQPAPREGLVSWLTRKAKSNLGYN